MFCLPTRGAVVSHIAPHICHSTLRCIKQLHYCQNWATVCQQSFTSTDILPELVGGKKSSADDSHVVNQDLVLFWESEPFIRLGEKRLCFQ